eukprot:COSAG04_NODE_5568_length_1566_cov_1.997273_3_plen_97_part_01
MLTHPVREPNLLEELSWLLNTKRQSSFTNICLLRHNICLLEHSDRRTEPHVHLSPGALWESVGPERCLGAVFDVTCSLTKPGEVTVTSMGDMTLGEP